MFVLREAERRNVISSWESLTREANFLSALLKRRGSFATDHVARDVEDVVQKFLSIVELSPTEAIGLAKHWKETSIVEWGNLPVDQIIFLRNLKNALRPMASLTEFVPVSLRKQLAEWLDVAELVP